MIIGIGSDLVDIRRIAALIEAYGDRFLDRIFTAEERQKSDSRANRAASYAKRFAAKEACVKALGTGFTAGLLWQEISVSNDSKGKPQLTLSGTAQAQLEKLIPMAHAAKLHLSLSDDDPYAQAFVVIETIAQNQVV